MQHRSIGSCRHSAVLNMASGSGFQTASQLLVLCIFVTWCTASFDASTRSQIDDVIEAGMRCRGTPGLALAVVKDGKVRAIA